jgi:hypothetical protein
MWQKHLVIEKFSDLEVDPEVRFPHKETCIWAFGAKWKVSKHLLSKWLKKSGTVRAHVMLPGKKGKKSSKAYRGDHHMGKYPDWEDELYIRFIMRRTVLGYPCNVYWCRMEFARVLEETPPPGYVPGPNAIFKCSHGWAVGFCVRYKITTQAKNNIKAHDQKDREIAIRNFHVWLHQHVQTSQPNSFTTADPKYGRFGPDRMYHVDQVPLPFASEIRSTLNPKGAVSCRIAGTNTSGLEKRQATLQLWICADPDKQSIKPTIIFRGSSKPGAQLPKPKEKALFDTLTNIRVAFQTSAWADGKFCQEEIYLVAEDLYRAGIEGEVMIGMDNHRAQRTPEMEAIYRDLEMMPIYTAAGCTDCISPVDHHVGRFIQQHMGQAYQNAIEKNPHIWRADVAERDIEHAHSTSALARRMLMAQWLSDAWTELITNHTGLLLSAFVRTGFLLALDGSEDHLMQIQGWPAPPHPPYAFRKVSPDTTF